MSTAAIRAMTPDDYDAAYALWEHIEGMGLRTLDDSRAGIARMLRHNPATCLVAEAGGGVVGTILCGHDGRRGFLYHLAVDPACRRQGIGRALVDTALAALEAEGIKRVGLLVYAANESGNRFWESMGFVAREDLVYRSKALDSANH